MPLTKDGHLYSGYESKDIIIPEKETEEEKQLKQHLVKKLELLEQEKNKVQIEETNRRFRENQTKLLLDFVNEAINKDHILRYDGLYKFIDEFVEENINE